MILGIEASNIISGGGVTHLVELLKYADPAKFGFSKVIVWASRATLAHLEKRPWLVKQTDLFLEGGYWNRFVWQHHRLSNRAQDARCTVIFVPGGSFITPFRPIATMCQNMLPFEFIELRRFGLSRVTIRYILLRWGQLRCFKKAQGTIFLSRYARDVVIRKNYGLQLKHTAIIPHGLAERFFIKPRLQKSIRAYNMDQPFRILYVSIINMYKHQWHLIEAVSVLRAEGFPVVLDLIGPSYAPALKKLKKALRNFDPLGKTIHYIGAVAYQNLHEYYSSADLGVFSSSCENLPNILLENMAAGLPIACSNRGPMPEVLRDGGVYFNPEDPSSITDAIRYLIESPMLRTKKAQKAHELAKRYSWNLCADETFKFLAKVAIASS